MWLVSITLRYIMPLPNLFHSHPSISLTALFTQPPVEFVRTAALFTVRLWDSVLRLCIHESTSLLSCHHQLCLSSSACASSRTAYSSSTCTTFDCVNSSHTFLASNQKNFTKSPHTVWTFWIVSASHFHQQGSGSQREFCSEYLPRSRAMQNLNKTCQLKPPAPRLGRDNSLNPGLAANR